VKPPNSQRQRHRERERKRPFILFLFLLVTPVEAQQSGAFEVFEASITELQTALSAGRVSSVALVDAYLKRIAAFDQAGPRLNAMIRLNPSSRAEAAALDVERRAGRVRGPLHGIPIILKDNFETNGLATSGSSVALAGLVTSNDAYQVRRLRAAGVIILGKSNMHELAAGITTISSLGGQTRNPYDPARNPGGSSGGSGAAVAASFAALAWGTDTCGSIRIPAAFHNLFGLRPTKGLSSIDGIIPLAHTQDVAGPLARNVTDLAIGLDATVGADPNDPATRVLEGRTLQGFVAALDTTALRGVRLGLLTSYVGNQPEDQEVARVMRAALDVMKQQGAEVIDVAVAGFDSVAQRAGVINFEFKFDLQDFLAARANAPVRSLSEILERGLHHVALEATFRARDTIRTRDSDAYKRALARRDSTRNAVLVLMNEQRLDALVYPTVRRKPALIGETQRGANCQLSAVTGLPALSAPAGFTADGLPVGLELLGRELSDARLLALAYDYEQAARPRRPPPTTPPLARANAAVKIEVAATGHDALRMHADFSYDALSGRLEYDVRVSGVEPPQVHAITLIRATAEQTGPTQFFLAGPGRARAQGSFMLQQNERSLLEAGRLVLVVYTSTQPHGAARATLTLPRS
jgi:Asp-tRNA(Asn)/Glu-tRNA(Gln) amidotransferase A subunit family amidase